MLNGPSDHPNQLQKEGQNQGQPQHFVVPEAINKKWWTPADLIEAAMRKHGHYVATYPWVYILGCFLVTILSSLGLMAFRWENNIVRLWNPTNSETGENFAWLWKNHPPELRRHSLIFYINGGNVLSRDNLLKMYDVRQMLYEAISPENVTWSQACLKVPLVPSQYSHFMGRKKEEEEEDDLFSAFKDDFEEDEFDLDLSVKLYPEPYCSVFNSLEKVCFEDSILELFARNGRLNRGMIEAMEDEDILRKINDEDNQRSGIFSVEKDFKQFLGGIKYDSEGRKIIKAEAVNFNMFGKMNVSLAHLESISRNSALGDQLALEQIDENTRSIEDEFIKLLLARRNDLKNNSNLNLDFIIAKSFPDAVNERITGDIPKVLGSFLLMFIYVTVALGKLNCVDNKSLLGLCGLFSVLMALLSSYGICSISGYFISPLHNFIPFLLLGLGVDDMFVIVQAFQQLPDIKNVNDLPAKVSKTLADSGVAITVTSLTDLLAFAIGGTTTVPALKSFCIYCGLGIFVVYVFQVTWFTAWLVIDQRRMLANRHACCPCIVRPEAEEGKSSCCWATSRGSSNSQMKLDLIGSYARLLCLPVVKAITIVASVALLAVCIYGNYMIEEEFDPWLFLDPESYPAIFKAAKDHFFPDTGETVWMFFSGTMNKTNLASIEGLLAKITDQAGNLILSLDSWFVGFQSYFVSNLGHVDGLSVANMEEIGSALVQFLFSPNGGRYQYLFTFDGDLRCGHSLPDVFVHVMELTHRHFNSSSEGIEAMNTIKHLMRTSGFEGRLFPFSPMYSVWEIDEIIRGELYRNVCLATLAITVATVVLLSNLIGSCLVILCVFITLTNVSGIMYFWGLNIDTVTSTVLIVCIGLSVDFSVHVIHAFLHAEESQSRDTRMRSALKAIAPAVLNGGFSTLLAVILLVLSDVYVFVTFYKIFILVVFFGLFNGLVLLPVLLTLIGPMKRSQTSPTASKEEELVGLNVLQNNEK